MCTCPAPVKHECGGYGQFVGITRLFDVFFCVSCGATFFRACDLVAGDVK